MFFLIFKGVGLRHFPSEMHIGCLVCVICNSKTLHFFLLMLCIVIVHILKMCTYILCTVHDFFHIFEGGGGGGVVVDFFQTAMYRGA